MKVLHVETGRHLYGGALQVFYLLRGLQGKGVESILVCPEGSEIARAAAPFCDVRTLPMRGELDPVFGLRLIGLVRQVGPDLLHVHSRRGADLWGALASRLSGVPGVVTRRVDNPEPVWLARLKYRQFRHVVAISQGIRQVLLAEGVPADRVSCVHSAVDTELYKPEGDRRWLEEEFNLPAGAKAIGMAAQFIPRKGHDTLLEAIPAILGRHPEARFLLFGKGPLWSQVGEKIRLAGYGEAVRLPGFRSDLPKILPALDLLVHPASMEGLGVALLQAAACGLPIVAGNAGGIPEIVRDGINGWLIAPGDADLLADRAIRLLGDEEARRQMGSRGRAIALADFSIEEMTRRNLACYQDCLEGRT